MSYLLFFFCLISLAFCKSAKPDYCWRDYYGEIPEDAVPGPILEGRRTFYATAPVDGYGRVYARFLENATEVRLMEHYESDMHSGDLISLCDHDIQILCSSTPEKFQWVDTTSETIEEINDFLVPAGYDNQVQHIGMEKNITGKVANYRNRGHQLYYVSEEEGTGKVHQARSFSVLVYKP